MTPERETTSSDFDEDAALDAAWESRMRAPSSVLEVERKRQQKGHRPDTALEKWGPFIEEDIERELAVTR